MRFIACNMALAGWLLLSAFSLGHSPDSAALTGLMAVLIGTFALASPGLRGLRFVNAVLACVLSVASLMLADVYWIARLNNMLVAAVVCGLSLVPGRSTYEAGATTTPDP
jgi:ABC-type antimicrobial peptide transport system permease subunit